MLRVKKSTLLLAAGAVWLAAGVNILRIGITALVGCFKSTAGWLPYLLLLIAAVVLTGFSFMFYHIVGKYQKRILGYPEEKKSIFYCFDLKGYLLMAFMMGLGIGLRVGNFLPDEFFAAFYSGLGTALSVAGIRFIVNWSKQERNETP